MIDHSRAPLREKVCFGCGAVAYMLEMILTLQYLMLFCSDVLKIDVALIGVIFFCVRFLDAVSDVLVTELADRFSTKWGRYRIWILSGIPLAVMTFLLFLNPGFSSATAKTLWLVALYIMVVPVFETALTCPYYALIVTMSEHSEDRLDFSHARSLGEAIAQAIVSFLAMPIICAFGTYKDTEGWRVMVLVLGTMMIICTLICFFGTRERLLASYFNGKEKKRISFREKVKPLRKNSAVTKSIFIILLYMMHFYTGQTLFSYFCIYTLGQPGWVSPLTSLGFVVQIVVTVLLIRSGRVFEKKTLLIFGAVCLLVSNVFLITANGLFFAAIYQILLGIGDGIFNDIAFALLPDATDYTEWKSGIALPGLISALATFFMKMGGAAATLLSSRILVFARYDESLAAQTSFTVRMLRLCIPINSFIWMIAATLLVLSLKELSKEKVKLYRQEINARGG